MSNTDPARWKQRLQQFTKAEQRLTEALENGHEALSRLLEVLNNQANPPS